MRPRGLGIGLLIAVASGLAASWIVGSILTRGRQSGVMPEKFPAQAVTIETPDHLSIAATFTPGRNRQSPAVLLLHGIDASRQATAGNAAWLAELGYATLAIDFRGHGQSNIAPRSFGLHEAYDAHAAFRWLKQQQNGAPVAVIGISLGGAASLIGDEGPLPADALVLQAVYPDIRTAIRNRIANLTATGLGYVLEPFLSFQAPLRFGVWPSRLSPLTALARYPGPVLVIGGEQDRSTPPDESRAMFAAVAGTRELWLLPQGDHAAISDLADAAYRARIKSFLERVMSRPG